jgi:hypothetical protein
MIKVVAFGVGSFRMFRIRNLLILFITKRCIIRLVGLVELWRRRGCDLLDERDEEVIASYLA